MIPLNLWEHQNAIKSLYANCVEEVCVRHKITRIELDILLFLANNPCFDTATDIVEIRYLAKSQVSSAIKGLESNGFLRKEHAGNNKKTEHLKLCDASRQIIEDGRNAQKKFAEILFEGFSLEETRNMREYFGRIWDNINKYLKEVPCGHPLMQKDSARRR